MLRLVGGVEVGNGLDLYSHAVVENPEGHLSGGVPHDNRGVSAPCRAPQPVSLEEEGHITSGCDNQWGFCPPRETEGR